ncbi:hypothetical protein TWF718_005079 [Orbilia javanica]|uniref:Uncharacterized protein n=1 Tax=Orbilia javanica TaxID=47235 RepID=A0AAN8MWC4_9PEZI
MRPPGQSKNTQEDQSTKDDVEQEAYRIARTVEMTKFYTETDRESLHCPVSLDKFRNSSLPGSHIRNTDQVLVRYQKSGETGINADKKEDASQLLCMVDRLWVCVVDSDTIVTAFPRPWYKGSMDLYQIILDHIFEEIRSRPPISDVWEMVPLITSVVVSASIAWRCRIVRDHETVFNVFSSAIWVVSEQEIELLDEFTQSASMGAKAVQGTDGELIHDISREINLLKEVKDIGDELNIIKELLQTQANILGELFYYLAKELQTPGGSKIRSIVNWYGSQRGTAMEIQEVSQLLNAAEQVHKNIHHLLDLRQKQANLKEAVWARESSEAAAMQGKTVLVFTVVTIIFLPITFLSSLFALDITSFPHNAAGDLSYPSGWIFPILFGITFAVAAPLITFAFFINEAGSLFTNLRRLFPDKGPEQGGKKEKRNKELSGEEKMKPKDGVEDIEDKSSKWHFLRRRPKAESTGTV